MAKRRGNRKSALITEEAAEWFVRLRDDNLGLDDRRRYVRWLKQSPAHIAEMLRIRRLAGWLRDAKPDGLVPHQGPISNIIELASRAPIAAAPPATAHPPVNRPHRRVAAALSAFTLAMLLAVVVKVVWFDRTIETAAGEWRHLTLADGSIARVGPRSRLRVEFDDSQRSVYLSRGEAVFHVAKDPGRPFLVNAELAVVRAVGTEFGVARHDDTVIVTVAEGAVAVSQGGRTAVRDSERDNPEEPSGDDAAEKEESIAVSTGEQVSVSRDWPVTVQRVDPTRELAWADGKLIFDNDTTLAQAIEQFNRRNRLQIEVEDPALASSLVCCIFSADDPESFALSVATKPNVALVREGPHRLRLVVALHAEVVDSQPLQPR